MTSFDFLHIDAEIVQGKVVGKAGGGAWQDVATLCGPVF